MSFSRETIKLFFFLNVSPREIITPFSSKTPISPPLLFPSDYQIGATWRGGKIHLVFLQFLHLVCNLHRIYRILSISFLEHCKLLCAIDCSGIWQCLELCCWGWHLFLLISLTMNQSCGTNIKIFQVHLWGLVRAAYCSKIEVSLLLGWGMPPSAQGWAVMSKPSECIIWICRFCRSPL